MLWGSRIRLNTHLCFRRDHFSTGAIIRELRRIPENGGIIVRETGRHCVAGIKEVDTRPNDGDQVEVDRAAGSVRLIRRRSRILCLIEYPLTISF